MLQTGQELGSDMSSISGRSIRCKLDVADFVHEVVEYWRIAADEAGAAHIVVVGAEHGKLVRVGNEPKSAVEAPVEMGIAAFEEDRLVADDVLQKVAVGERRPAEVVPGEAG